MKNEQLYALIVHGVRGVKDAEKNPQESLALASTYLTAIQDAAMTMANEQEVKVMFRNARRLVEMEQEVVNKA